ncbi:Dual specificity mitogenactivated protein kinase kinase hemipterouslike, partial [Caligus rogercresseyi]
MKSSSEEMRSKLKAFKFDEGDRRSRPGGLPSIVPRDQLRFASSAFEQESKLSEIMSHTGILQTTEGRKVKARIDEF